MSSYDELGNIDLIKKIYLQQDLIDNHFDRTRKIFSKIIQQDTTFLIDYVNNLYLKKQNQHYLHEKDKYLNVVWESDNIEPLLKKVFDFVNEKDVYYGFGEHFCNSFFWNLPQENKERAKNFLLDYCRENHDNSQKINVLIDIARYSMLDLFEEILLLFISLTQDEKLFSEIWWIGNGGAYFGEVIFGDIEATKWKNILSIVEKSNLGIKLLPIKLYINNQIESNLRRAEWERQRKFIQND